MPPRSFNNFNEATFTFNGIELGTIYTRDMYLSSSSNNSNNDEREQRINEAIQQEQLTVRTNPFTSEETITVAYNPSITTNELATTEERLFRLEDAVYNQQRPDTTENLSYFTNTDELYIDTSNEITLVGNYQLANRPAYTLGQNYVQLNDYIELYYHNIDELIEFREKIDKKIRNHFKGK